MTTAVAFPDRDRRVFLGLVIAVLLVGACKSPEVAGRAEAKPQSDGAFVWRGFEHAWTYNHRLNRMGDFLTQKQCTASDQGDLPRLTCTGAVHHTGASGTGRDALTFTSHYTETGSDDAHYHPARAVMYVRGREQRELRREQTVRVPVEGDGNFVALLNGYDLRTAGKAKAKKVKRFRIRVTDRPTYNADTGKVRFKVGAILNANCDSAECKTQRNEVYYRLETRLMLIRSDKMHANSRRFETSYRWTKKTEIHADDIAINTTRQTIDGRPESFETGLLGFREIDFDLAKKGKYKDHWFVHWENVIDDIDYNPGDGRASFDLRLFFKEWNARTKKKALSLARAGEATLASEVVLVQLPGGRVQHDSASGSFEWRGKNRSADDPAAEWKKELRFEF